MIEKHINIILIFVTLFLTASQAQFAQSMTVPLEVQCKLLPKILSLDKSLKSTDDTSINVGIIFNSSIRGSIRIKNDIFLRHRKNAMVVNEIPIIFIPIDISKIDDLATEISQYGLAALYITPLRAFDINIISEICKKEKVVSFTSVPEFQDYGISIGFDLINNKLKIVINVISAKNEGADFSSHLLKIAKVINK